VHRHSMGAPTPAAPHSHSGLRFRNRLPAAVTASTAALPHRATSDSDLPRRECSGHAKGERSFSGEHHLTARRAPRQDLGNIRGRARTGADGPRPERASDAETRRRSLAARKEERAVGARDDRRSARVACVIIRLPERRRSEPGRRVARWGRSARRRGGRGGGLRGSPRRGGGRLRRA
jgi:hypothetical protein